jgi:alcohol dehydrogenase class IV
VDARVLPDVICLVPEFSASMNLRQSVTSLLNALAHPISALWGSVLDHAATEIALAAATEMSSVIAEILQTPDAAGNRRRALVAAGACARCLQGGKLGPHHRWAHALGGRYLLEHGLLHSVLLPHSIRVLRVQRPALSEQLHETLRTSDLAGLCFDYLAQSGAETALLPLLESAQVSDASDASESAPDFAGWRERLVAVGIPELVADDLLLGRRPSPAS